MENDNYRPPLKTLLSSDFLLTLLDDKKPLARRGTYREGFEDAILVAKSVIVSAPDCSKQIICKNCKDAELLFNKIKERLIEEYNLLDYKREYHCNKEYPDVDAIEELDGKKNGLDMALCIIDELHTSMEEQDAKR